jgi:low affinity Fe/Cu permease
MRRIVPTGRHSLFTRFAKAASRAAGRPAAFLLAVVVLIAWAASGPVFRYSDTWQLVINTGTTIVTFLMVFLIQNTQNRDTEALQVKIDELIRALDSAENALLDLEELEDEDLDRVRESYRVLARKARASDRNGGEPRSPRRRTKPSPD